MIAYQFFGSELEVALQECADFIAANLPANAPPDGFKWKPMIKLTAEQGKTSYSLTWVAELIRK